jgi:hypothetical protein
MNLSTLLAGVATGRGEDLRKERLLETPVVETSGDSGESTALSLVTDPEAA